MRPPADPRFTRRPIGASTREAAVAAIAEDRVDDEVDAVRRSPPATGARARRRPRRQSGDGVRTRGGRRSPGGGRPAAATTSPAPRAGRPDGDLAHRSAGAQHEHPSPRAAARPLGERHPGRHGRQSRAPPRRRPRPRAAAARSRPARRRRRLGQAAVARAHAGVRGEPDRRALGQVRRPLEHGADALHAGHVGQRRLPEVGRARGAQSRSSGTTGAAVTRTRTCPGAGSRGRYGTGSGGSP